MPLVHLEQLSPKVGKSDLLRLFDQTGGLPGKRVGRIELAGGRATVEVPSGWERRLAKTIDGATLHGRKLRAWADDPRAAVTTPSTEEHFQRLGRLLELERQAEAQRALDRARRHTGAAAERSGEALVDLVVADEDAGLGGRYLLTLVKRDRRPLPWTRLSTGSPVVLSADGSVGDDALRGVVYERRETSIAVAVANLPEAFEDVERWRMDLSSDEVSSERQRYALERAARARGDRLATLREVLMGERAPEFAEPPAAEILEDGLNEPQREAIQLALAARDVALIHGPPGTGKTTTLVELIRQAVRRGDKVLACGPSNLAVDNLFERLLAHGERVVRLGHPARVMPALRSHTLDELVERHEDVRLSRKLVKDALALFRRAAKTTRAKPEPGARRELRSEARSLLADARRLEAQAVEHILDTADILCATTTGLDDVLLGARRFDLAVIDEACQSSEPGCWIPLARAERAVLAGDHCQLPPTVISDDARRQGFAVSMFERLAAVHPAALKRLEVQYRMHESIMGFSSLEFYDAALVAHESVAAHELQQLPGVQPVPLTAQVLAFVDTAGGGYDEEMEPDGQSRFNRHEADWIVRQVNALVEAGVAPEAIGVITPYAAQARLLRERLALSALEIDTVDGFQGREKEAILISLVRSNDRGEIGFLSDVRRMNVAMTRARRKLMVIGDSATLSVDPFYARMISYFESLGAYRTIWEEDMGA